MVTAAKGYQQIRTSVTILITFPTLASVRKTGLVYFVSSLGVWTRRVSRKLSASMECVQRVEGMPMATNWLLSVSVMLVGMTTNVIIVCPLMVVPQALEIFLHASIQMTADVRVLKLKTMMRNTRDAPNGFRGVVAGLIKTVRLITNVFTTLMVA